MQVRIVRHAEIRPASPKENLDYIERDGVQPDGSPRRLEAAQSKKRLTPSLSRDAAKWTSMATVKQLYRTASVVSADRVVFNIKGNDYRLVVAIDFEKRIMWIKWLGSHAEYDTIDVKTVAYERPKADSN